MRSRTTHTCSYCGTTYSKREHYERHVRTHTRERPYKCLYCPAAFSRQDTLGRHTRTCRSKPEHLSPPASGVVLVTPQQVELPPSHDGDWMSSTSTRPVDGTTPLTLHTQLAPDQSDNLEPGQFDWQWDDALDLDASFSWNDLGTYDVGIAKPSTPWLPLRQLESPRGRTSQVAKDSMLLTRPPSDRSSITPASGAGSTAISKTPVANNSPNISTQEIPRVALANSLMQPLPDATLPPTHFLNRCIQTYTTRLWPLIPVVHLPTFQPARTNPLLLLSICSLGALAEGTKSALFHADRLYEGVQKAILVSFSPKLVADEQALSILQAAAIGQTFAILSGQRSHLLLAQCFHGTLGVFWQIFHEFETSVHPLSAAGSYDQPGLGSWHEWIRGQTIIRLLNSIHIHNGEIAAIMHQPAHLRAQSSQMILAAADYLFLSKNHIEWAALHERQSSLQHRPSTIFSSCARLDWLIAEISHCKSGTINSMGDEARYNLQSHFVTWIQESREAVHAEGSDRLSPLALWHSCFILLLSDVDRMEHTYGASNATISNHDTSLFRTWASSVKAKQSILHACSIYKHFEHFQICDVPAIHVARCLWHAGLVLAVYSQFCSKDDNSPAHESSTSSFEEFRVLEDLELLTEDESNFLSNDVSAEHCKTLAYSLSRMLRHLGPWMNAAELSLKLEHVLQAVDTQTA